MRFDGFVGPTYESRSVVADAQRTINLIPEVVESGSGKSRVVLYRAPGTRSFATLSAYPVLSMLEINGRLFGGSPTLLEEIFSDASTSIVGNIFTTNPAGKGGCLATNGTQVMVATGDATGGPVFCFDLGTSAFTEVTDLTGIAISWITYLDGYFIAMCAGTQKIYISALYDGTSWNLLDVASAEAVPDDLIQIVADHKELWLFGGKSTQVYYNSGNADFPFEPIPGAQIETGAVGKTVAKLDNTLFWLGQDERGGGMVWRADGYRPVRVSNHWVENALKALTDLADARAFSYQDGGHSFYWLYVPSAETCFVYDVSTGMWHERATLAGWGTANLTFAPHRANCHCYAFGKHLVGDRDGAMISEMSQDYRYDAWGGAIPQKWMRRAPHLSNEMRRLFYHELIVDFETGGTSQVAAVLASPGWITIEPSDAEDKNVNLRYSNDGGRTWSAEIAESLNETGLVNKTRVHWHRLGAARDRVFEVSGYGTLPTTIIDAFLELTPGTN